MSAMASGLSITPETPTRKPMGRAIFNDPVGEGHSNTSLIRGRGRGSGRGVFSGQGGFGGCGRGDFNVLRGWGNSNPSFSGQALNPLASPYQPSPGTPNAWQSWDARAADARLAVKNESDMARTPSRDPAITDTFVPVGFNADGSRKKNRSEKSKTHFPSMDGADEQEKKPSNFGLWEKMEIEDVPVASGLWQKSNPAYKDLRHRRGFLESTERSAESPKQVTVIDAGAFGIIPSKM